jgi:hypothetical protein
MAEVSPDARYRREMSRGLILGGFGCSVAGETALASSTANASDGRLGFAAFVLALEVVSFTLGVLFRVRNRPPS